MFRPSFPRSFLVVVAGCAVGCARAATPTVAAAPAAPRAALARAAAAYAALEKAEVERLSGLLDGLISDPALVEAFKARDRERLLAMSKGRFERLKAAHGVGLWYFVDPSRVCFLRVHSPTLFGDVNGRDTLTRAIAGEELGHGEELGRTAFGLRVVKPIRAGGAVIGDMELGEEIGQFLLKTKEQTGDDYGVLFDKRGIERQELARVRQEDRWGERADVVLIDSTVWNERLLELPVPLDRIPDGGIETGEWVEGNRRFVGGAFPLRDAAGRRIGVLYVRHAISS